MDREKVVKGLECHYGGCEQADGSICPYWEYERCSQQLMSDTLNLLEKQKAVEPEVEVLNEIDKLYRCPKCHKHFFYEKQKYCDQCGQAVKWE